MSVRELYRQCARLLTVDNRDFEARQLVEFVLGLDQTAFLLQADRAVDPQAEQQCFQLVRRRNAGEPLYYILGETEFYGLRFYVTPQTLIPRPETELLVQLALERLQGRSQAQILDLCAGTGCVGITLANTLPDATVTCVELYEGAFSVLQRNIALHQVENVTAVRADALTYPLQGADLLVCNPPYIARREAAGLQPELCYEPEQALFAPEDGLAFYKRIAVNARQAPGLQILFEIGWQQGGAVTRILKQNGFSQICVHRDLSGNDRVVSGIRR